MALEAATYVADLVVANPPNTDNVSQGDDHLRLLKAVLQATFPGATGVFADVARTWGAAQTFSLGTAGATPIELISTDAGAAEGPILSLYRNSASPLANDVIGGVAFYGKDSATNKQIYAGIQAVLLDPTSGSEDADLRFQVIGAGAYATELVLNSATLAPGSDNSVSLGLNGQRFAKAWLSDLRADGVVELKGTVLHATVAALLNSATVGALRTSMGIGTGDVVNFAAITLGGVNPWTSLVYESAMLDALGFHGATGFLAGDAVVVKRGGAWGYVTFP